MTDLRASATVSVGAALVAVSVGAIIASAVVSYGEADAPSDVRVAVSYAPRAAITALASERAVAQDSAGTAAASGAPRNAAGSAQANAARAGEAARAAAGAALVEAARAMATGRSASMVAAAGRVSLALAAGTAMADVVAEEIVFSVSARVALGFEDIFQTTDTFSVTSSFVRAATDSITAAEAMRIGTGLVKLDSVTATEAKSLGVGKVASDSVSATDASALGVGKGLSDSVSPTEASTLAVGKVLADTVTPAESATISLAFSRTFWDYETATMNAGWGRHGEDGSGLNAWTMNPDQQGDMVFATDLSTLGVGLGKSDSVSASDAAPVFATGKVIADSALPDDSVISLATTKPLADAFTPTDSVSVVRNFSITFNDPDTATMNGGWGTHSNDGSGMNAWQLNPDEYGDYAHATDGYTLNVSKVFSDSYAPSDAAAISFGQALADSFTPSESLTKKTSPVVSAVNTGTDSTTGVTSSTVNLPASIASGDLLIAIFAADATPGTITWPAGWTQLFTSRISVAYKIATGSEGSTMTVTTVNSVPTGWRTMRITNWHGTTPPESANTTGSSTNANPPSLTPSWGTDETLWIAAMGGPACTISGFPSGFTGNQYSKNTTASIGVATLGERAASKDPGTFTNTTFGWGAATIAVRPA